MLAVRQDRSVRAARVATAVLAIAEPLVSAVYQVKKAKTAATPSLVLPGAEAETAGPGVLVAPCPVTVGAVAEVPQAALAALEVRAERGAPQPLLEALEPRAVKVVSAETAEKEV